MSKLLNTALKKKSQKDRQLPDGDSQPWLTCMSSFSQASGVTWLWVKEKQFEAQPLDIWSCGRSQRRQVLSLQNWEFYKEAEQLQFPPSAWKREALCLLSPRVNSGPNVFYKQRAAL